MREREGGEREENNNGRKRGKENGSKVERVKAMGAGGRRA
jgi:hypothetical protein